MADMEHPEEGEGDTVLQVAMVVTLPKEHQVDLTPVIINRVLHLVQTLSKHPSPK
jgi:hypothetical protein